jgi:ATP-dependent DNA helicase RecQ
LGDVVQLRRMIEQSEAGEAFKRVSLIKLDALLGLCETAGCRRVRLLDYFGETNEVSRNCGNCDNCLEPPQTWDATEAVRKALSCIYRTGQRFGAVHLIDVLRGRHTARVAEWGHDGLGVFGIGGDLDDATWRNLFRQLVALGYARPDHAAYGALQLTEASRPVLRGEERVAVRREAAHKANAHKAKKTASTGRLAISAGDAELLARLKAWRLAQAQEQSVPAFVIFHDSTLAAIAAARPQTAEALAGISGIGARKLERYGAVLLELLRQ